jgi:hypothetical protein
MLYQWLLMAVLGGWSERVSATDFPDDREDTGNSLEIGLLGDARGQHLERTAGEIP